MSKLNCRALGQSATLLAFACLMVLAHSAAGADLTQLETGAQHGSIRKQLQLGADYFLGHGVQRNEELAAYWYEKAANSGDSTAQLQIGYFYQVGIGVSRDAARAAHWYQLAAAGGSAVAKMNLGVAYLWGAGVPRDQTLALQLFHQAADKGCATAAGYLGDAYALGVGVPKDLSAAEHWFAAGAKMHDPRSEARLASYFSGSIGQKMDLPKAAALLRESSGAGFVPAKHALGLLIANHPELSSSPNEAVQLLEEASAAGTWKASAVLGALARDGRGLPTDARAAYLHFKIAQLQGGDEGRDLVAVDLAKLTDKLSQEDAKALDLKATQWVSRHSTRLEFVYKDGSPAFALTAPNHELHAGRLMPNPD
ncbi:MAG TPA: hypothetical protein VHZ28_14165 [Terracidiphilus sp.]|nr:hypothetical protein [Terracidiphilus sp.]